MKIVIFLIVFRERRNVIKMHEILGGFYPVYRKGRLGGSILLKTRVKQMSFEWAKICYKTSDIFIVFGERQKRYKNV